MKKILHIIASPRGGRSHSRRIASYFIDQLMTQNPRLQLEEIELTSQLPEFGKPGVTAKFKKRQEISLEPDEQEQWEYAKSIWLHFQTADCYVFSIPMWNFSMPYEMKHYIDLITQPGWLFDVTPEGGYKGLMHGKKAFIAFATGNNYNLKELEPLDHLRPYLRFWTQFIGLDMYETTNHSTNLNTDHEEIYQECTAQIDEIVNYFIPT